MHYLPDTEDEDAAAERYWPDSFKEVIRRELRPAINGKLNERSLGRIYQRQYSQNYAHLDQFVSRILDMAVIGAENGADNGFESLHRSFMDEEPLPEHRPYARYLWPHVFSREMKTKIHQAIMEDYRQDDGFQYAYQAGYTRTYRSFDKFIETGASLVVSATENGLDDMLGRIYKAFMAKLPLPPARRNPKRLKQW